MSFSLAMRSADPGSLRGKEEVITQILVMSHRDNAAGRDRGGGCV